MKWFRRFWGIPEVRLQLALHLMRIGLALFFLLLVPSREKLPEWVQFGLGLVWYLIATVLLSRHWLLCLLLDLKEDNKPSLAEAMKAVLDESKAKIRQEERSQAALLVSRVQGLWEQSKAVEKAAIQMSSASLALSVEKELLKAELSRQGVDPKAIAWMEES